MNQEKRLLPWTKITQIIANIMMVILTILLFVAMPPLGLLGVVCIILYNIGMKKINADAAKTDCERQALKTQVDDLSRFQSVSDAESEAARIKAEAQAEAERLTSVAAESADILKANSQKQAEDLLADAKSQQQSAREKLAAADAEANRKLDDANLEARRIISDARVKAEEIAGEAYQVKNSVDELRQTETALRNSIKGYGDEWLKPTYSLLDELADEFSYDDAGRKLKDARSASARMVRIKIAATCDYVEQNRQQTAINFVVDAFNGKVDSILSKTKHDNYGKLEQQIRDAYSMVNYNGKAFRNARIQPEYLEARLQELKWAVVVMELRKKEQEEQRQIREQMREEARAQREYERAQKEAAKEEAMLQKAMEKAKAMLEKASDDQKAKFEAQLAEYEQRLKEAEERNQRALSMAQQTRHGNVYVISNIGSFGENIYKVGMTRRLEPMDRVRELGDASVPFAFDVHAIIESDDAPALEHALHQELAMMQVNKVNPRKEFFRVSLSDIRALVESHGLTAKWTMTAEAAEYHETIAIEERMKNDPDAQKRWAEFYERVGQDETDDEE